MSASFVSSFAVPAARSIGPSFTFTGLLFTPERLVATRLMATYGMAAHRSAMPMG